MWPSNQTACRRCSQRRRAPRRWLALVGLLLLQATASSARTLTTLKTPAVVARNNGDPAPGRSPGPPRGVEQASELRTRGGVQAFESDDEVVSSKRSYLEGDRQDLVVVVHEGVNVPSVTSQNRIVRTSGFSEEKENPIHLLNLGSNEPLFTQEEERTASKLSVIPPNGGVETLSSTKNEVSSKAVRPRGVKQDLVSDARTPLPGFTHKTRRKRRRLLQTDDDDDEEDEDEVLEDSDEDAGERHDSYLVGEFVRNLMLTRSHRDLDVATARTASKSVEVEEFSTRRNAIARQDLKEDLEALNSREERDGGDLEMSQEVKEGGETVKSKETQEGDVPEVTNKDYKENHGPEVFGIRENVSDDVVNDFDSVSHEQETFRTTEKVGELEEIVGKRVEQLAAVEVSVLPREAFVGLGAGVEVRDDERHNGADGHPTIILTAEPAPKPNATWCDDLVDGDAVDGEAVNISVSHDLFRVEAGLVAGVVYHVTVSSPLSNGHLVEFAVSALVGDVPCGLFAGSESEGLEPEDEGPGPEASCLEDDSTVADRLTAERPHVVVTWSFVQFPEGVQAANVTFRLRYRKAGELAVFERLSTLPLLPDCTLQLRSTDGDLASPHLPATTDCHITFATPSSPTPTSPSGIVVELTRLNVPCTGGGYLRLNAHLLCGKLEELPLGERHLYLPIVTSATLHFHRRPVFALRYRLVDYCYNVTLSAAADSRTLLSTPTGLHCTFKIHLPYGNRVSLNLDVDGPLPPADDLFASERTELTNDAQCADLLLEVTDGEERTPFCRGHHVVLVSQGNSLSVRVRIGAGRPERVTLGYRALAVSEVRKGCAFGWVAVRGTCVTVVDDVKATWTEAEAECGRRHENGHLASVRGEDDQEVVDNLLINSVGYRDHNSYWIGASDRMLEGDFRWTDGQPFSFANWFPGWSEHGHANRQPNDDGFSDQDCVELRRGYHAGAAGAAVRLARSFMWNDRDCATGNYFLCEAVSLAESASTAEWNAESLCNRTVTLSREQTRVVVTSPGFPRRYPDNVECVTEVVAPADHRLLVDFEELVLEQEPNCSYDFLEVSDLSTNGSVAPMHKLCGDWSDRLKLLRLTSNSSRLRLRFVSDYSHQFGGFKVKVSAENAVTLDCGDARQQLFNRSCYLFVSYPEVTWQTAHQICNGLKAELASVGNAQEQSFVTSRIRLLSEYTTSAIYWLGGQRKADSRWAWLDSSPVAFSAWSADGDTDTGACLSVQWQPSRGQTRPSGLYWNAQPCDNVGGYVCKREKQVSGSVLTLNRTTEGVEGLITSPNYPNAYPNDLDYWLTLVGPPRTRIVVTFARLELEPQTECLYDAVELQSDASADDVVRWCGSHGNHTQRLVFVSIGHTALVHFRSDFSVSGSGFSGSWTAADVAGCPQSTITARHGSVASPHFPRFMLPRLDCATVVKAPAGRRVWLEFAVHDLTSPPAEATLELRLSDVDAGAGALRPFTDAARLNDGAFLSDAETLTLRLRTGDRPEGRGYEAHYKTVVMLRERRVIELSNVSVGWLGHLNAPMSPPPHVDYTERLIAPLGWIISLEFHDATESTEGCPPGEGSVMVSDFHADTNGSSKELCHALGQSVVVVSYFNALSVRQLARTVGVRLNASIAVLKDGTFKSKLIRADSEAGPESCTPAPCLNGGKCLTLGTRLRGCQCAGHFTGLFCALTVCETEPCLFGVCVLTPTGYTCRCQHGYVGATCDQKQRPCDENPCEGRGECIPRGDSFHCRCHAWWEGAKCERRMMHIPFKPLSERMLQEPFWLGLITVTVVLGVIGIIWCAKRHFPEKLEKLLAEEADRNRSGGLAHSRPASVREQMAAAAAAAAGSGGAGGGTTIPSPTPGCPRTLLGRLGIRKPSLLSLTSPHGSHGGHHHHHHHGGADRTARTFSLDDLLKPPPPRTPSPRKKRNNSTPVKKIADKTQILQQLITPTATQRARKMSLVELMQLGERKPSEGDVEETKFDGKPGAGGDSKGLFGDAKLEKKVHFARLLSKVSAEMSSGSEVDMKLPPRSTSTPPSPACHPRSPHSTSSNQGSDSMSSLDVSHHGDQLGMRRQAGKAPLPPRHNASADSILAMFRNFNSTSGQNHMLSPSTTPTPSSPQDEQASPTSSTSSVPTPLSSSSFTLDSPPSMSRHSHCTIEVSVLDTFAGGRKSQSGLTPPSILLEVPSGGTGGKCLSPIREMPTPLPSPCPSRARSPVLCRANSDDIHEDLVRAKKATFKLKIQSAVDDSDCSSTSSSTRPTTTAPVPLLVVEQPSPTRAPPGSPPPHRGSPGSPPRGEGRGPRRLLKEMDKPVSLDLPCPPPMITVTCLLSETESDTECASPPGKGLGAAMSHLLVPGATAPGGSGGMCYLSPFSVVAAHPGRATSESNLSSSGYSSMTSPGPSRCGSNNPLCPTDSDDHHLPLRRPSPLLGRQAPGAPPLRLRSDSETMSDDPYVESNDEGFGTDHLDDKIEDGQLKSAKELEVFIGKELLDSGRTMLGLSTLTSLPLTTSADVEPTPWLGGPKAPADALSYLALFPAPTLPSDIAVDDDWPVGKHESPDLGLLGKIAGQRWLSSDQEYWTRVVEKLALPVGTVGKSASLEVSDASMTSPSGQAPASGIKKCRSLETPAPTLGVDGGAVDKRRSQLQLPSIVVESMSCPTSTATPGLEAASARSESPLSDRGRGSPLFYNRMPLTDTEYPSSDGPRPHRKSTRRRDRKARSGVASASPSLQRLSGSTSSSTPTPVHLDVPGAATTGRKPSPKRCRARPAPPPMSSSSSSESINSAREIRAAEVKMLRSREASGEETGEELGAQTSQDKTDPREELLPKAHRKFSRLRTISHQIRFLRRVEQSLRRRERLASQSDSGEDEPPILKTLSHNELPGHELLIPRGDRSWRKATIHPSGHTD